MLCCSYMFVAHSAFAPEYVRPSAENRRNKHPSSARITFSSEVPSPGTNVWKRRRRHRSELFPFGASLNGEGNDDKDGDRKEAPEAKLMRPLFPELAAPPPSSYDDAADALQSSHGGTSPSNDDGRPLSASERIRSAVEGGDIFGAIKEIARARRPGGDWDDDGRGARSPEAGNGYTPSMEDGIDAAATPDLASLDYLLEKLKDGQGDV
eukprot:CAMPEP_0197453554 /NCGR_PEP_ID=MMETSP1175-20131217/35268_1 /TAXON_ID=1003142 /ORGANISM="Triceratium dubium, Strain CCMP147" /LENGTH=208 /DNA_ID=CAMNT_0042986877 /DNA_START=126 /DNA_END=752 /DNA_ORIENTATION=+